MSLTEAAEVQRAVSTDEADDWYFQLRLTRSDRHKERPRPQNVEVERGDRAYLWVCPGELRGGSGLLIRSWPRSRSGLTVPMPRSGLMSPSTSYGRLGFTGSDRTVRRAVAEVKANHRRGRHPVSIFPIWTEPIECSTAEISPDERPNICEPGRRANGDGGPRPEAVAIQI